MGCCCGPGGTIGLWLTSGIFEGCCWAARPPIKGRVGSWLWPPPMPFAGSKASGSTPLLRTSFRCLCREKKRNISAAAERAPTGAPTPMPIFAVVERPDAEAVELEVGEEDAIEGMKVARTRVVRSEAMPVTITWVEEPITLVIVWAMVVWITVGFSVVTGATVVRAPVVLSVGEG